MNIVMLLYPGITPLDLFGPLQAWSLINDVNIQLVWKNREQIETDTSAYLLPSCTFDEIDALPRVDILFVPGGKLGAFEAMQDQEVLDFLNRTSDKSSWITSVCTGALILGAAGLLEGYKATTHWTMVDMLHSFGAVYTKGRYVIDRNRVTGGGVTAGIDFGLAIISRIIGIDKAQETQLLLEYNPDPPFNCGHPDVAPPILVNKVICDLWAIGYPVIAKNI